MRGTNSGDIHNEASHVSASVFIQARDIYGDLVLAPRTLPAVTPQQVPPGVPNFVDRRRERRSLDALLRADAARVALLTGPGGVGKTALAIAWAALRQDAFPDGQLYLNLRGFDRHARPLTPSDALLTLLNGLGLHGDSIPPTLESRIGLFRTLVSHREILIVLDNLRAADQVQSLLPSGPGCRTLLTSRHGLVGLGTAVAIRRVDVPPLDRRSSRSLLAKTVGKRLRPADEQAAQAIITHCAGLPLAVAIIGARARTQPVLGLPGLASEIADRAAVLQALDLGEADLSVRVVFQTSYRGLTPEAARLFRLIGLHVGAEFSAGAAGALAGLSPHAVRPVLAELVDASLVDSPQSGRYRCHDLLQIFALERADDEESVAERAAATGRMLDFYLFMAFRAACLLDPQREPIDVAVPAASWIAGLPASPAEATRWFDENWSSVLTCVTLAADRNRLEHVWKLAWSLADYLDRAGHAQQWVSVQEAALSATEKLGDLSAQAGIHRQLAWAYLSIADFAAAVRHARQAVSISTALADRRAEGHGRHVLGWSLSESGEYGEAMREGQAALAIYEELGVEAAGADALNNLAWYQLRTGAVGPAAENAELALRRYLGLGNSYGEALALDTLAGAETAGARLESAIRRYQRALSIHRDRGDHYYQARVLTHLSEAYRAALMFSDQVDCLRKAAEILRELRHPELADVESMIRATVDAE
ncbi:tetratricopeptide repeat protein [Actinoplanes subtropicus]|uniref:tetratricopeptide repeat protein n=1 Tax=Actinoplanes subtropicus TaxID=543632 RepID=UPI0004C3AE31|nr:tetratricopeptide repeat protein [Actinoplanes subtropicus]